VLPRPLRHLSHMEKRAASASRRTTADTPAAGAFVHWETELPPQSPSHVGITVDQSLNQDGALS
jgi:hypothetical protein